MKECILEEFVGESNNYKLPTLVDNINYAPLLAEASYEVGKYWKDAQESKADAGSSNVFAVDAILLSTNNGVFVSSKNPAYVVDKVACKIDGVFRTEVGSTTSTNGIAAINRSGEMYLYITAHKVDGTAVGADLDLSEILEIKSQDNPYINNDLVEAYGIYNNEPESSAAFASVPLFGYMLINFGNSLGLQRKKNIGTLDSIDTQHEKTVKVGNKYYRYNGSLYVEI